MDNNPIHKLDEIEDAIEAAGAWVLFLPTYSPDLNPIENCWSKVKTRLRSLKPRTLPDLLEALVAAFASITLPDILGWFRHCGYRVALTEEARTFGLFGVWDEPHRGSRLLLKCRATGRANTSSTDV